MDASGSGATYINTHNHGDESCACVHPGCGFAATPLALVRHFNSSHSMPITKVNYGKVFELNVLALLDPPYLLLADDDSRAFLLVGGVHGLGAVVSMVCIRSPDSLWPRYRASIGSHTPHDKAWKGDSMMADMEVASSTCPGDVEVEDLTYLELPPKMLVHVGGDKMMPLKICIEKITTDACPIDQ